MRRAALLTASVVFLTKMTTWLLMSAPKKRPTISRASSYASLEISDLNPLPRWMLEYHGMNKSRVSITSHSAGVVAALSRFT